MVFTITAVLFTYVLLLLQSTLVLRQDSTNGQNNHVHELLIRTSNSGPEAQLFLIKTSIVILLRGVGLLKNDHKRPIYDELKTHFEMPLRNIVRDVGHKSRLVVFIQIVLIPKKKPLPTVTRYWYTLRLVLMYFDILAPFQQCRLFPEMHSFICVVYSKKYKIYCT